MFLTWWHLSLKEQKTSWEKERMLIIRIFLLFQHCQRSCVSKVLLQHCQRSFFNTVKGPFSTLSKVLFQHCQRSLFNTVKGPFSTLSKVLFQHCQRSCVSKVLFQHCQRSYPLPNDNFVGWTKLKAFADDTLNGGNIKISVFERVENIVG